MDLGDFGLSVGDSYKQGWDKDKIVMLQRVLSIVPAHRSEIIQWTGSKELSSVDSAKFSIEREHVAKSNGAVAYFFHIAYND